MKSVPYSQIPTCVAQIWRLDVILVEILALCLNFNMVGVPKVVMKFVPYSQISARVGQIWRFHASWIEILALSLDFNGEMCSQIPPLVIKSWRFDTIWVEIIASGLTLTLEILKHVFFQNTIQILPIFSTRGAGPKSGHEKCSLFMEFVICNIFLKPHRWLQLLFFLKTPADHTSDMNQETGTSH